MVNLLPFCDDGVWDGFVPVQQDSSPWFLSARWAGDGLEFGTHSLARKKQSSQAKEGIRLGVPCFEQPSSCTLSHRDGDGGADKDRSCDGLSCLPSRGRGAQFLPVSMRVGKARHSKTISLFQHRSSSVSAYSVPGSSLRLETQLNKLQGLHLGISGGLGDEAGAQKWSPVSRQNEAGTLMRTTMVTTGAAVTQRRCTLRKSGCCMEGREAVGGGLLVRQS